MSLQPLLTNIDTTTLLFALAGAGGGGGGGGTTSTFNTLSASTLSISSMNGALGPGAPIGINGPLLLTTSGINMGADSIIWPPGAPGQTLLWNGNDGQIGGLSTINGSAYPPAATGGGCFQLGTNGTVTLIGGTGGATQDFTPAFTTVVNDYYRASICLVYNTLSGSPAGNAFLFFKTTGDVIQNIHIPLSSITAGVPFEIILFFKGTVTSTAIQAGLNDSAASQCTVAMANVNAAPVGILEKLGAAQVLT